MTHPIQFVASGRGKSQCPPDPKFPNRVASGTGAIGCFVALPYLAPECGYYLVICDSCEMSVANAAAGRADDPISIVMPCGQKVD